MGAGVVNGLGNATPTNESIPWVNSPRDVPSTQSVSNPEASLPHCAAPVWAEGVLGLLERHTIDCAVVVLYHADSKDAEPAITVLRESSSFETTGRHFRQLCTTCKQVAEDQQPRHRKELSRDCDFYAIPVQPDSADCPVLGFLCVGDRDAENTLLKGMAIASQFGQRRLQQTLLHTQQVAEAAAAINEIAVSALKASSIEDAAQVIASDLERHCDFKRVIIGRKRKPTAQCEILAASDVANIEIGGAQYTAIQKAFDEALLLNRPLVISPDHNGNQETQQRVSQLLGDTCVITPFADESGSAVDAGASAVILGTVKPNADCKSPQHFLSASAPAFSAVFRAIEQRPRRTILRRTIRSLTTRRGLCTAIAVLTLAASMFLPYTHRETCPAVVEPVVRRFVATPFDATLLRCEVQPGDHVRQGQVLAVLEDRQLHWQLESLRAEYQKAQKTKDAAQAVRDFAKQRIAELDMQKAMVEIRLLEDRLDELQVCSPIDGIVVAGDHQRSQGVPLQTGDTLFEIAPLENMMLEFSIAEHQVMHVDLGAVTQIRLDAISEEGWESQVQTISPQSEIRNSENVFIGECPIPQSHVELRPGMTGTVSVDCGRRAMGWILFHRPYEVLTRWVW
ncbi:hypothetical protein C2E31_27410 [Rhodopirellula baltica]|nr:hypothetical protein C2E31_27410 [Rhodopirellula baltica]